MDFRTIVDIPVQEWLIEPFERLLFVGSCFAMNMGKKFQEALFPITINPFGVMYNPASILHTIEKWSEPADVVMLTLGTNRVYVEKATGEIVDNCQKRPQNLFEEQSLTVEECADYLVEVCRLLKQRNSFVRIVFTVSPIRYRKYGYHGNQLSKATLLLATEKVVANSAGGVGYFPAYELINDELRDYRFYANDMLHPSEQAIEYLWERFSEVYLSPRCHQWLKEWKPIQAALAHKPFLPNSAEYMAFREKTEAMRDEILRKWRVQNN